MKTVQEAPLSPNTRVFVRCDLDVPIVNNQAEETSRLESLLPTLKFLQEKKAKIIIAGHMADDQSTVVLKPFFDDKLGAGSYILLENLRLNPGEKENSTVYAKELAEKSDIYVNESFATSHREHASIVEIPKYLPAYAGLHLAQEIETLTKIIKNPKHPLVTVIGGAKLESKLPVVNKFLEIADAVLLGGKLWSEWKEKVPENLFLPLGNIPNGLDISPETIDGFSKIISSAATVIWVGPMGYYQNPEYIKGTQGVAEAIINSRAFSVVGGGDTITALNKLGLLEKFNFVSTGGGAMLDFLAKGTLPGLEALNYHG